MWEKFLGENISPQLARKSKIKKWFRAILDAKRSQEMIIFHNIAQEMRIYPQYVSDGPNNNFMTEFHNIPKIYD